jgi:oligosaccharide reducing-end xylanase
MKQMRKINLGMLAILFFVTASSARSVPPSSDSSWTTRNYTNYFTLIGLATDEHVQERLNQIYHELFSLESPLSLVRQHQTLDAQYVFAIDSNDIRSEGMSYGMMIAVMMDDQETFNRLWNFVVFEMWQQNDGNPDTNPSIGDVYADRGGSVQPGWVGWSHSAGFGYPKNTGPADSRWGQNPAPDGELYMAAALFLAHEKWGSSNNNGTIYSWSQNYQERANDMLRVIRNLLWSTEANQIVFSPSTSRLFTDPSYHLPAFYELFAQWAELSSERIFWDAAANTSRDLLVNSAHGVTGLAPSYSEFNGSPINDPQLIGATFSDDYAWDSWRVIHNMAMDYSWWSRDSRFPPIINRQLNFLGSDTRCGGTYCDLYSIDGGFPRYGSQNPRREGQIAMNAVGASMINGAAGWPWIQELWSSSLPTESDARYYNSLLYMLGYLHVSGRYLMYRSEREVGDWLDRDSPSGSADSERLSQHRNSGSMGTNYPCQHNPTSVLEAQTISSFTFDTNYPQRFEVMNAEEGFICRNDERNDGSCTDYEVSYLCAVGFPSATFNRDGPSGNGDFERFSQHVGIDPSLNQCGRLMIQVREANDTSVSYYGPPDNLAIFSPTEGLLCRNDDQTGSCEDYRIRLVCH